MRTFSVDFAMESLQGVHPDGAEQCPPLFNVIAMRDAQLVRWMCKIVVKSVWESLQTRVCQGIAPSSNRTKPLTGARHGTKVCGRVFKWPRNYWFPWSRRGQGFFFFFSFFKGISSSNSFKTTEVKVSFFSSLVYFIGLFVTPWLQKFWNPGRHPGSRGKK